MLRFIKVFFVNVSRNLADEVQNQALKSRCCCEALKHGIAPLGAVYGTARIFVFN